MSGIVPDTWQRYSKFVDGMNKHTMSKQLPLVKVLRKWNSSKWGYVDLQ